MLIWIILLIAFLVAAISILGCPRVTFPRKGSVEGLENPAVAQAYDRISQWPQFRFLRCVIISELKKLRHHFDNGGLSPVPVGCLSGDIKATICIDIHLPTEGSSHRTLKRALYATGDIDGQRTIALA